MCVSIVIRNVERRAGPENRATPRIGPLGVPSPIAVFTLDEANAAVEKSALVRVREDASADSDSEAADSKEGGPTADAFAQAIVDRLRRPKPEEPQAIAAVQAGDPRRPRAEKARPGVAAENPLDRLARTKRAHEVAKWDGVEVSEERQEIVRPWKEAGFDEWDRKLDQGHIRKVKKKRPAPIDNPFDHIPIKRSAGSFHRPR
jgi:hypothetical protein